MKIGILTFHRPINYGAFLQAYSLSNMLIHRFPGVDVEIIDYLPDKEKKRIRRGVLSSLKRGGISSAYKEIRKIRIFKNSLKYLKLSNEKYFGTPVEELLEKIDRKYDLLIIGSDAVFNWNQTGFPTAFIPNFHFKHCKVMSYSVSVHGLKYYEVDPGKITVCKNVFENMEFITVRDKCTEKFVEYCYGRALAHHACDPTCFVEIESIEQQVDSHRLVEKYPQIKERYIVLMLLDENISKMIYDKYHEYYKIVSLFKNNKYSDVFLYDLNPFEWAYVIKKASLVVTSYFHGMYLSMVQNTPSIMIDLSHYANEYESKFYDLIYTRIGVPDIYFSTENFDKIRFEKVMEDTLKRKYVERVKEGILREKQTVKPFVSEVEKLLMR